MSVSIVNNRIIEKLLKRGDKIRSVSALHPIWKLRRNYNIDSCEEIEKEIKRLNDNINMMEGRKRLIKCQSQKNILSNHNSFEEEKNSSLINDIKQPLIDNEQNVHLDNNNITPVSDNENKIKLKSFKHNHKENKEESKEDIINQDNNLIVNQLKSNRREKNNCNNSNDDTTVNTNMKYSHLDNKNKQIEKKFISNNQGYIGDEYHHNKRYQNNNKFDSCYSNRTRNAQFDIATLDSGNDLGIRSSSCLYCSKSIEVDKDINVKLSNEEPIMKKSNLKSSRSTVKSSMQSSSSIPKKKLCTMSLIQSDIKPKLIKTSFPQNDRKNTYELYKDMKRNKMNSNSCRNIDSNKSIKINPLKIPITDDKFDPSHNIYSSNRIPLSSSTKTFDKENSSQSEKINSNRSENIENDTNNKMSQIPLHNSKLIKYIFKSPSTSSLLRKPNLQPKQRVRKLKHIRTGSTVRADKLLKSYFELL